MIIAIYTIPLIFNPSLNIIIYLIYLVGSFTTTSVLFYFYIYQNSYWSDITKFYLENIPNQINFRENEEYAGVVIADNNLRVHKYFHIYNGGVLLLIEHLRNQNIPIKIVKKVDEKNLKELIYDEKCTELYIFGHGRRYGLKIHKNKFVNYANFTDAPKKMRVEQFHCNHKHKKGKALSEILDAEEKYKTLKTRTISEIINCCMNELLFEK